MKKYGFEKMFYVVDRSGSFYSDHRTLPRAKKALAEGTRRFPQDPPIGVAKIVMVRRVVKK